MGMAATAGHDKACFYLANWYYRISLGDIPSPEKEGASNGVERELDVTVQRFEKSLEEIQPFLSHIHVPFQVE